MNRVVKEEHHSLNNLQRTPHKTCIHSYSRIKENDFIICILLFHRNSEFGLPFFRFERGMMGCFANDLPGASPGWMSCLSFLSWSGWQCVAHLAWSAFVGGALMLELESIYICILESDPTQPIRIVDLAYPSHTSIRHAITTDSAILHPQQLIIALKASRQLQILFFISSSKWRWRRDLLEMEVSLRVVGMVTDVHGASLEFRR